MDSISCCQPTACGKKQAQARGGSSAAGAAGACAITTWYQSHLFAWVTAVWPHVLLDKGIVAADAHACMHRAPIPQARARLFALSFTSYMISTAAVSVAHGLGVARTSVRYGATAVMAVATSAALELRSRRAFLEAVAREQSKAGSGA